MTRPLVRSSATPTFIRRLATALACLAFAGLAAAQEAPLKVAVYDAPPYGLVEPDGSIDGVSVDLWRRGGETKPQSNHRKPGVAADRGQLFRLAAIVIPARASEPPRRRRAQARWWRATVHTNRNGLRNGAPARGRGRGDAEDQHRNRQRQHQNRHEQAAAPKRDGQRRADRADHRQRRRAGGERRRDRGRAARAPSPA